MTLPDAGGNQRKNADALPDTQGPETGWAMCLGRREEGIAAPAVDGAYEWQISREGRRFPRMVTAFNSGAPGWQSSSSSRCRESSAALACPWRARRRGAEGVSCGDTRKGELVSCARNAVRGDLHCCWQNSFLLQEGDGLPDGEVYGQKCLRTRSARNALWSR